MEGDIEELKRKYESWRPSCYESLAIDVRAAILSDRKNYRGYISKETKHNLSEKRDRIK